MIKIGIFKRKKEDRADEPGKIGFDDALLQAILGKTTMTKEVAMQIPAVSGAVNLIGSTIAGTPIKLYHEKDGETKEVSGDRRVFLLNDDTKDTLTANEFWKAIIVDYFLGKGGYAYINKQKGRIESIHYVDEKYVAIQKNNDPIFKSYDILVNGNTYYPFEFIKILRNSKDGMSGTGIIEENKIILEVAYQSLLFENALVKKGGNKKGFLKSENKLEKQAMDDLKAAFKNLYSNNEENVLVLNKGIDFKESSNTSVEMQLNENKKTNTDLICMIFVLSSKIINGIATDAEMSTFAKIAIMPILKTIECALNRDLLLEKEKGSFYFAFDTKELLKGSLLDRYKAYEIAVRNGWKTRNEIRYAEDDPAIDGMDIISMSLADVIYDIHSKSYFTPNTKMITDIKDESTIEPDDSSSLKGGE